MPEESVAPRIAVTLGDLSGVGPELIVRLLSAPSNRERAAVTVIANEAEIARVTKSIGGDVPLGQSAEPGVVAIESTRSVSTEIPVGEVSRAAGLRSLEDLRHALSLWRSGAVDGILFGPLNKSALHLADMEEHDELRWFARELGVDSFTSEVNVSPGIVTSRVTSHIPLSAVAAQISAQAVLEATRLLNTIVLKAGVKNPRIAVCALNPHAGENGQFGREEIDHIAPAVALARHEGIDASGPFPSDTVFLKARDGDFDGVVTMFHDQGQIAMKLLGFDKGVTVEAGLPVPIATPAHGTAHDIVGLGIASLGATQHAFDFLVAQASAFIEDAGQEGSTEQA